MDDAHDAWTTMRLRHSLQALAIPAESQLAFLPDFVCKADELALEFSDWYDVIMSNQTDDLMADQRAALETIYRMLDDMSGQENAPRWTDDAVRPSPDWDTLQALARTALSTFGWEIAVPPSYAHEYVPGQTGGTPSENS